MRLCVAASSCLSILIALCAAGADARAQSPRAPGLYAPPDMERETALPRVVIRGNELPPGGSGQPDLLQPRLGHVALEVRAAGDAVLEVGRTEREYVARTTEGEDEVRLSLDRIACVTPCTLYVPPGAFPLFARGAGFAGTTYTVPVGPRGARVRLRAGSVGLNRLGGVFTALGGGTAAVGLVVLFVGIGGGPSGLLVPGIVTLLVGSAMMGVGVPLLAVTGPALLETRPMPEAPRAAMLHWRVAF